MQSYDSFKRSITKAMLTDDVVKRFKDALTQTEDCWLWNRKLTNHGYATLKIGDEDYKAHRISWVLHNDAIPDNLCVCHRCDVRHCVNPDHLFLGTNLDNVRDKIVKGRSPNIRKEKNPMWKNYESAARGARQGSAKLNDGKVIGILQLLKQGDSQREVARIFNVSQYAIWCINANKTWTHINRELV